MSELGMRSARGLMLCTGLAVTLAGSLQAQTVQTVFGGKANDAARGGVVQTNDGGFITVGESQSFGAGDYDVYVVKTDQCGNLQWSATYDIGGDDFGRKIRQTADDGYIIVGSTADANNCCSKDNIFLLKLLNDGTVDWAKTYGGTDSDEGMDVQLYNGGKEYVVAGSSASFGSGKVNAYLMRTSFFGNVIEARVYGGDAVQVFNSVAVSTDGSGDIFAAGGTNSYGALNEVYVGRFDASLVPVWLHHHGGKADESANSIITAIKGQLVLAGYTTSLTNAKDGYILRLNATTGAYINDRIYFPIKDPVDDEFTEIREINDAGELAVTGYTTKAPNSFGDHDVYLSRILYNLNTSWARVYGAELFDEGWSLTVNQNPDQKDPDYTIAGVTTNWAFGQEDLYFIRTDANGKSGCNDADTKTNERQPKWTEVDAPTQYPSIRVECDRKVEVTWNKNQKILCQDCKIPNDQQFNLGALGNGHNQQYQTAVSTTVAGPTGVAAQR